MLNTLSGCLPSPCYLRADLLELPCAGVSTFSCFSVCDLPHGLSYTRAHSVSPCRLTGPKIMSSFFNFQIYFIKLHEKVLQALIYAGTFFTLPIKPSDAEGKALQTPTNTAHSKHRKYHHTHYPVKNIRRNQDRNRGARRSPHTRKHTP